MNVILKRSVSRMFIPDPNIFHSRSRIRFFPSRIRIKEFKYFNKKKFVPKLPEIWYRLFIPDPDPGYGYWFLPIPDPGSRGQTRHRIPDRIRNTGKELFDQLTFLSIQSRIYSWIITPPRHSTWTRWQPFCRWESWWGWTCPRWDGPGFRLSALPPPQACLQS